MTVIEGKVTVGKRKHDATNNREKLSVATGIKVETKRDEKLSGVLGEILLMTETEGQGNGQEIQRIVGRIV